MTPEQNSLTFPTGLPGLPEEYKKFTLTHVENDSPFYLLQAEDDEHICLILINPFLLFKDYEFDLPVEDKAKLEISAQNQVAVFAVVNASEGLKTATVNLLAPIVVNAQNKLARQVILNDQHYSLRQPLPVSGGGA